MITKVGHRAVVITMVVLLVGALLVSVFAGLHWI
jgi:hypothetical protein